MALKYKRCLLKISGEALGSAVDLYDQKKIKNIAKQIVTLNKQGLELAIVIGGGNIWRGSKAELLGMDKINADYMGMMATVMNALALESTLKAQGLDKVLIESPIEMNKILEPYYFKKAIKRLQDGYVVIMAAGTGYPYFTTDTAASLRAIEIDAEVLLMAKNGVDGIYDSDPKINKNAVKFDKITYDELTQKQLRVMDLTASSLAMEGKLSILVFDINEENNICKAAHGEAVSTIVYGGKKQ